mgnify:CR=1 FL=1|jgi:hypothetical protein
MISNAGPKNGRSRMEVNSIAATVPTSYEKDYTVQSIAKAPDAKYKVTDTIYTVITYDKNGKLDQSTNIRYLDYII